MSIDYDGTETLNYNAKYHHMHHVAFILTLKEKHISALAEMVKHS